MIDQILEIAVHRKRLPVGRGFSHFFQGNYKQTENIPVKRAEAELQSLSFFQKFPGVADQIAVIGLVHFQSGAGQKGGKFFPGPGSGLRR